MEMTFVVLNHFKTKHFITLIVFSHVYNNLTVNERKLLVRSCIALYHWLSVAISLYVKLFGRESYKSI